MSLLGRKLGQVVDVDQDRSQQLLEDILAELRLLTRILKEAYEPLETEPNDG